MAPSCAERTAACAPPRKPLAWLARSRHASARSLARYARPGVDAVARHVAERARAARLPGYSVLLVDEPDVQRLSDLPRVKRLSFLSDMDRLGEAVERACRWLDPAFCRVNLEILGNTDPFLRAHVWPRFGWEPTDVVRRPVWLYPRERWSDERFRLGRER